MAEYSHLSIFNGTPYDFIRGDHSSYQMEDWDNNFPNVIQAGAKARIQVAFRKTWFTTWSDDSAKQIYCLQGASSRFEIQAHGDSHGDNLFYLSLDTSGLSNDGHAHATVNMGWHEDSELYIWVAGRNDGYLVRSWWLGDEA